MENNTEKFTLTFHGGADSVTGANFLLEGAGKKILVDCGLIQGSKIGEDANREPFGYDPASIDILFITHAHIDHIGRIPKLVREGFRGVIYSTKPTREISAIMLDDSIGILEKEARYDNKEPLYAQKDVEKAVGLWKDLSYHEELDVGGGTKAFLQDAGHILGSAMVNITHNGKKIVFTGDLGNSPSPLLRDTEALSDVDYLVMESVYGDRNHESRDERKSLLEDVIEETVEKGGALVIPAFSLERTQELLFEINDFVENGRIPEVPVFLDSPLAIKVTEIYRRSNDFFNTDTQGIIKSGDDIFHFPRLKFTLETEESKAIAHVPDPKVIIAGSGMSNGGRIVHHEKRHLPDPKSTVLLMGYQAVRTPGRALADGAKSIKIHGEEIPVRARVAQIHGYSAHKDSDGLFELVATSGDALKKVFCVMGEPRSSMFLVQRIRDYLGIDASAPTQGESIELEF